MQDEREIVWHRNDRETILTITSEQARRLAEKGLELELLIEDGAWVLFMTQPGVDGRLYDVRVFEKSDVRATEGLLSKAVSEMIDEWS